MFSFVILWLQICIKVSNFISNLQYNLWLVAMTNFHSSVERMNSVFVLFCGFLVTSQAQYLGNETKSCSHHCINTEVNLTNEKVCR